ncbi:SRPBCC domain-containing protein [Terriglobus albidus]|uniref:SRPBCC domain-containing protein n=1 Tax=Terriglobus albidus TaxID=1592106 RepID=A0A5B9E8B7_9BACT|nr:SRPBCC domain-containing protein [Terriglobus albidus]QEE26701.1 SRPBCC domain-containing protein [Terriglobus albidus]
MSSSAENTRTLVIERVFPHTPEKLWRALTETPLIAQWLLKNDFAPTVGHKFQFRSEPMPQWDGVIDCEVLVVDPLKQLSYSWNALGLESVVLFTLAPTPGGTHLRMEHSGFRADQQAAYHGANYGWQKFLGGLERVLAGDVQ